MPDFRQRFAALVAVDRQPIRAEAPDPKVADTTAVLRLYDPIDSYGGSWGVSSKEFVAVLDELPDTVEEIRLLINSPGGEVWEGLAIKNALQRHKARYVAVVEGMAASSASFIACSADELIMAPHSELFVHKAWGLCVGNGDDMRKFGDELTHEDRNLASIYADKAGGTVDEWMAAMADETYYSAEEAVAAGLADRVDTDREPAAADKAKARHDLSAFSARFAGRKAAQASATPPSPTPHKGQEGASMTDLSKLRDALGLAEDVSDDDVIAAATVKAQGPVPDPEPNPDPDPEPNPPEGHVVIPEARLRDLEAGVAAGVEAAGKLRDKERTEFLDSVRSKYAPANRAAWEKEYDRDPDGTRKHFADAPDILPLNAIGNGGSADLDLDREYEAIYGKEATV